MIQLKTASQNVLCKKAHIPVEEWHYFSTALVILFVCWFFPSAMTKYPYNFACSVLYLMEPILPKLQLKIPNQPLFGLSLTIFFHAWRWQCFLVHWLSFRLRIIQEDPGFLSSNYFGGKVWADIKFLQHVGANFLVWYSFCSDAILATNFFHGEIFAQNFPRSVVMDVQSSRYYSDTLLAIFLNNLANIFLAFEVEGCLEHSSSFKVRRPLLNLLCHMRVWKMLSSL